MDSWPVGGEACSSSTTRVTPSRAAVTSVEVELAKASAAALIMASSRLSCHLMRTPAPPLWVPPEAAPSDQISMASS